MGGQPTKDFQLDALEEEEARPLLTCKSNEGRSWCGHTQRRTQEKVAKECVHQQTQRRCIMIQKLALDCEAQYHCYQPFLLPTDIIHLATTCRIWGDWIRSPSSVIHGSAKAVGRNRFIPTIRRAADLQRLLDCKWIHPYLFGCKIIPKGMGDVMKYRMSKFFQLNSPPPTLFTQLQSLAHIQHLTLGSIEPTEVTRGAISTYFKALSSSIRSLELCLDLDLRLMQTWDPRPQSTIAYLNQFLDEIQHLVKLEKLHIWLNGAHHLFNQLHLNHLPSLSHLHTFLCQNTPQYGSNYPSRYESVGGFAELNKCLHLRSISLGHFPGEPLWVGATTFLNFLFQRRTIRNNLRANSTVSQSHEIEGDQLEYLDLNTTEMTSDVWSYLAHDLPQLKTLNPYCWTFLLVDKREQWALLRKFTHLTYLHIQPGSTVVVDDFLNDLIHCTTVQTLKLGRMRLDESQLETMLNHLTNLVSLTLTKMVLAHLEPAPTASILLPGLTFSVPVNDLLIQLIQCDATKSMIRWIRSRQRNKIEGN